MARNNFLTRFLGLHDRAQKERTDAVSTYAAEKKEVFVKEMDKIKRQAKVVHQKQLQTNLETDKLINMVEGITRNIMVATGGGHRIKK